MTFDYNVFENEININDSKNQEENHNILVKKKYENPIMNDLKCSIIQILSYLYLKIPSLFGIKTHLFKVINYDTAQGKPLINKVELNKVLDYIQKVLFNIDQSIEIKIIDPYCLIQFLELIKYSLRNLYIIKNNLKEKDRDNIYNIVENVIKLLKKFIGLNENDTKCLLNGTVMDCLNVINNDKLDFKDPMFLVSENYQYVFLKYKNKLENIIKKQDEKGNNTKTFLNILCDVCDEEIIQKNKYDLAMAELTKKNIKLLKTFNLKGVLMDISIITDRNSEALSKLTLLIMEEIINECLEYLDFTTVEGLGLSFNRDEILDRKEYINKIHMEIMNERNTSLYLDEFKQKIIKQKDFSINLDFFKLLLYSDNKKIKNLAIDILYKLNSAKKIFYFNIKNLVIMEDENEYNKFIQIKKLFIELIQTVDNLNIVQRLDKNSVYMYKIFNQNIKILLGQLFDVDKWDKFIDKYLDKDFENTKKK